MFSVISSIQLSEYRIPVTAQATFAFYVYHVSASELIPLPKFKMHLVPSIFTLATVLFCTNVLLDVLDANTEFDESNI